MPYKNIVDEFKNYFVDITFEQIPRNDNKAANVMATIASLLQTQEKQDRYEFLVEELFYLAYDCPDTQLICHLFGRDSSHYGQIYTYLKDSTLPLNLSKNKKWNFIWQSTWYTLVVDTLYRWGMNGTSLKCLEQEEYEKALNEVRNSIYGTHLSGLTLLKKLIWLGYYWPTMERDYFQFVKKCKQCRIHDNLIHAPT